MNSKKIVMSAILVVLLIGGVIVWKINSNSSSSSQSAISETTEDSNNNTNTEENNTATDSKDSTSNNDENTNTTENNTSNQGVATNTKLSGKDAATTILKHFLDENDVSSQHIIPIVLNGQVAKAQDNDTTFFCDSSELNDSTKTGLIIMLESYDESNNSYKYTLKDYYAIVNGNNDSIESGTVSGNGTVTES